MKDVPTTHAEIAFALCDNDGRGPCGCREEGVVRCEGVSQQAALVFSWREQPASQRLAAFLASKKVEAKSSGIEPGPMPAHLFDFQADATEFCLRQGRSALLLDTGLGKTAVQLEWARQAADATNGRALILTPLAVARQIETEARRFNYNARVIREQDQVADGINICNYDRLHKLRPEAFGGVSLDESSILKSFMGKTTRTLIEAFQETPFRLCATATPAPNDHTEIGTLAEFLGLMSRQHMLSRWFVNDSSEASQSWRLKGHAVQPFFDWMASWAIMAESPEDMGRDGSRFILPPMQIIRHRAIGEAKPPPGTLFSGDISATRIHDVKRQTAEARAEAVAAILQADPEQPWIVWCNSDYEQDALLARLDRVIDVRGSMPSHRKEDGIARFLSSTSGILLTKPSVCGFGLNFQHCARIVFAGRSFSYEEWYQAVRRCWRFGQTRPVCVHLIVAEGEDQIGRVIDRKADDHAMMKAAMRQATRRALGRGEKITPYNPTHQGRLPVWLSAV